MIIISYKCIIWYKKYRGLTRKPEKTPYYKKEGSP